MILADTSVWIDHLRTHDATLAGLLVDDAVACHPLVIEELALGSIRNREETLSLLENLHRFPIVNHPEVLALVESSRLWARGLGVVDLHLLASTLIVSGAMLWPSDKRLATVCHELGVGFLRPT